MKIISKIVLMLSLVTALIMVDPINVEAASGRVMFTDLSVAAGDQFEITAKVVTYDDSIDTIDMDLKYDSEKIEFIKGDKSTGSNGKIELSATATGKENSYTLTFRALKNCETSITLDECLVKTSGGTLFTMTKGSSTIKIVGGTEVEASSSSDSDGTVMETGDIQVAGVSYEVSSDFYESEIPVGYSKVEMDVRGDRVPVLLGDTSDVILVYLEEIGGNSSDSDSVGFTPAGRFFVYDETTAGFSPYVQITVSDSTYIVFLSEEYDSELPEKYIPTTMTADGFDFPAWQDGESDGYYLIYAVSSKGVKEFYRYDTNDQSYQRYEIPAEPENPNAVSNPELQKIVDIIADNLLIFLAMLGLLCLLMLVLTLTFGFKLRNRNKEIDDIYETGINAYNNMAFPEAGEINGGNVNQSFEFDDYDDVDDEFEDELEDTLSPVTNAPVNVPSVDEDMLDDGLTQEFDISMNDKIFNNDGFINYNEPPQNQMYENQQMSFGDGTYGNEPKMEDQIGDFNKYQASSDDDIEFIEL